MVTVFQVWDQTTNNIVDEYSTEAEALNALSQWQDAEGAESLESLALLRCGERDLEPVAAGPDLVTYLQRHADVAISSMELEA